MPSKYEQNVLSVLKQAGFTNNEKLTTTLQGQIWKSTRNSKDITKEYIIKVTSRTLHKESAMIINGKKLEIYEDILCEKTILEYLSLFSDCPKSIVQYKGFFKSNNNYYLMMENGGTDIFSFCVKVHKLIQHKRLEITEWRKMVHKIFSQMVEAVQFMHRHRVAHYDISLENTLINDIGIFLEKKNTDTASETIRFEIKDVQIKIIDFGLAETFSKRNGFRSRKYCGKSNYKSPEIVYEKEFNAASNDVWGLGVCLFMLICGSAPFYKAHHSDKSYQCIMKGELKHLLSEWKRLSYFDDNLLDLFAKIFQFEGKRISLAGVKKHTWFQN